MKGTSKELKRYVAKHRKHLKGIHWDSLLIFKLQSPKALLWRFRNAPKKNEEY